MPPRFDINRLEWGPAVRACRYRVLAACTAVILQASVQYAAAADAALPPRAPVADVYSWTGLYLGGKLGTDFGTARYVRPFAAGSDTSIGSAARGLDAGAYGGANLQVLPWLVLGVEGEYSTLRTGYRELGPSIDFLQASKHVAAVSGRVGLAMAPGSMVYAKAGPAWLDTQGVQGFGTPFQKTLNAELFAVGVEALATRNIAVRAEAAYIRSRDILQLNQGFDQYRPTVLEVTVGAAVKLDGPPGIGSAPAAAPQSGPMFYKAAVAAPAAHWTGFEVGGFGSFNGDQMRYLGSIAGQNNEQGPYTDGVFGGGWLVGGNVQIYPSVVGGLELEGNYQKANFNDANGVGLPPKSFHFASTNEVYALAVRLGWLPTPSTLVYAKGGPAMLKVTPDPNYWNALAAGAQTQPVWLDGLQYGAGAETFINSYFSIRVEGLYTQVFPEPTQLLFFGNQPLPIRLKPSLLTGTLGAAVHF